jgi:DNA replication and repair protein RecF
VRVTLLRLREFRSYSAAQVQLGDGITVVQGRNGAGKTNLLEGLYVGCTGRSFRTANQREAIRFGTRVARVELDGRAEDGPHSISVGLAVGEPRRIRVDDTAVERLGDVPVRPLASVFAPDRLELVKAGPGLRRAHLDRVVAALWPARAGERQAYARALVQRNALLARMRVGAGGGDALRAWDSELASRGVALMATRRAAVAELATRFVAVAALLGLDGDPVLAYRPRSTASTAEQLAAELLDRREADLNRAFTGHGPHRDEILLTLRGRELRTYGSQGQQRLALLALLLAEREAIAHARETPPLMLLDDAMSELDGEHRGRLVELLAASGGQSVITTTELDQVPGARDPSVTRVTVAEGAVLEAAEGRAAA